MHENENEGTDYRWLFRIFALAALVSLLFYAYAILSFVAWLADVSQAAR